MQCSRLCAAESSLVITEQAINGEVEDMIWIGREKQIVMVLTDRFGRTLYIDLKFSAHVTIHNSTCRGYVYRSVDEGNMHGE